MKRNYTVAVLCQSWVKKNVQYLFDVITKWKNYIPTALTHSLTHLYSLTPLIYPPHSLTPPIYSLTHSHAQSGTLSHAHSGTHSATHSLTHSFIHSVTQSLTRSPAPSLTYTRSRPNLMLDSLADARAYLRHTELSRHLNLNPCSLSQYPLTH